MRKLCAFAAAGATAFVLSLPVTASAAPKDTGPAAKPAQQAAPATEFSSHRRRYRYVYPRYYPRYYAYPRYYRAYPYYGYYRPYPYYGYYGWRRPAVSFGFWF